MLSGETKRSVELQRRDIEMLRGLFDSRLITLAHAAAIHFEGRQEAAKKRIQKLKAAGLIGERKRKVYEPSVLFLTRQGFSLLHHQGHLHGFPQMTWPTLEKRLQVSDRTVRHELEVMDVKAAFAAALRKESAYSLTEFSTWPLLFQFKASHDGRVPVLVKPDAFLRIEERSGGEVFEHTFFLEVDRSTETLDTLGLKALRYLDYYRRGGLAIKAGRPRSEYKDFPFRVLMIFKTEERRDNVAKVLLNARLLQNPIYYGSFNFKGELHEGKHQPLVSKILFDKCQQVMREKSQPKLLTKLKPFLYRRVFRCGECGCFVTIEEQKGHHYLRCTKRVKKDCSQPYMREERIAEQIAEVLNAAAIPDDWADWMIGELRAMQTNEAASAGDAEQAIRFQLAEVTAKLDRLTRISHRPLDFFGSGRVAPRPICW